MGDHSTPEIPREISILPVTKEAADAALSQIALDPSKASLEEGALIETGNHQLNLLLHTRIGIGRIKPDEFIEGALWTHRILRTQAERRGNRLPEISRDLADAYLMDGLERVRNTTVRLDQDVQEQTNKLMSEEPELGQALQR